MIKFTATNKKGRKILFLGLSEENLAKLRLDMPIKIDGKEAKCSHDVYVFYGRTEAAMLQQMVDAGVDLPDNVKPHLDDDTQQPKRRKH